MRAACTNLIHNSVTPSTLRQYSAEVAEFVAWAQKRSLSLSEKNVDQVMVRYFEFCAHEGDTPHIGRLCLYGFLLLRLPHLAKQTNSLPLSRLSLRGWLRQMPGRVRDPAPIIVAWHLASHLLTEPGPLPHLRKLAAAAIILQVDTYCRPGALLDITCADLFAPTAAAGRRFRYWTLILSPSTRRGRTKTGQQDDSLRLGVAGRSFVPLVARWLKKRGKDADKVFAPLNLVQFGKLVAESCDQLKLQTLRIVPHVFRHTGPSSDAHDGLLTLAEIKARGKWASDLSVRRYEKHGMVIRQLARMSVLQVRQASAADQLLPGLVKKHFVELQRFQAAASSPPPPWLHCGYGFVQRMHIEKLWCGHTFAKGRRIHSDLCRCMRSRITVTLLRPQSCS